MGYCSTHGGGRCVQCGPNGLPSSSRPLTDNRIGGTMPPSVANSTVLVTGASGGLGTQFGQQALALGARKVSAPARRPRDWDDPRIVALSLDVTDETTVAAAAAAAADTTI